jgi:hypothetical protein
LDISKTTQCQDTTDFRDVLTIDRTEKSARRFDIRHREKWMKKLGPWEREIEIELPADAPETSCISKIMNAVFLAPDETLVSFAPDYHGVYLGLCAFG